MLENLEIIRKYQSHDISKPNLIYIYIYLLKIADKFNTSKYVNSLSHRKFLTF